MSDSLADELAALRAEWGLRFRPVSALLEALSAQPRTPEQLVHVSGLSHRSVTGILRRLEPWLESRHGGYRLSGPFELDGPAGVNERDLQAVLCRLAERAPAPRRRLDHVAATPDTAMHRAAFLASRYWLDGARVLFMGDHDLTALALALRRPGARLTSSMSTKTCWNTSTASLRSSMSRSTAGLQISAWGFHRACAAQPTWCSPIRPTRRRG